MHDPHKKTQAYPQANKVETLLNSHKGFPINDGHLSIQDMHNISKVPLLLKSCKQSKVVLQSKEQLCESCRLGEVKSLWSAQKLFLAVGEHWNE